MQILHNSIIIYEPTQNYGYSFPYRESSVQNTEWILKNPTTFIIYKYRCVVTLNANIMNYKLQIKIWGLYNLIRFNKDYYILRNYLWFLNYHWAELLLLYIRIHSPLHRSSYCYDHFDMSNVYSFAIEIYLFVECGQYIADVSI